MDDIIQKWKPYIDEKYVDTLHTFFNNVFMQNNNDKMIIIKGDSGTGKTSFITNMVDYIGKGHVSHINDMKMKDLIIVSEPSNLRFEPIVIQRINKLLDMKKSLVLICNNIIIPEELKHRVEIITFEHHFSDGLYFIQK